MRNAKPRGPEFTLPCLALAALLIPATASAQRLQERDQTELSIELVDPKVLRAMATRAGGSMEMADFMNKFDIDPVAPKVEPWKKAAPPAPVYKSH